MIRLAIDSADRIGNVLCERDSLRLLGCNTCRIPAEQLCNLLFRQTLLQGHAGVRMGTDGTSVDLSHHEHETLDERRVHQTLSPVLHQYPDSSRQVHEKSIDITIGERSLMLWSERISR